MKLIDTNIIMYAVGKTHTLKEPCKEFLHKVVNNEISANIDIEVLQELLYVYDSRGERKRGLRIISEMMVLFPNPFAIGKNEIVKAKDLMTKYSTLTTRDAIHCAVTINLNLEGIISTDKGLDVVKDIHRFNPLKTLI
ncbi:MAG: type II toxin-antitoxin system VapC family toxin [Candidatus Scalindua sp.]